VRPGRGCRFLPLALLTLIAGCGSGSEQRRASIYELERHPTEESILRVRAMLDDPDRDVRATALNALVGLELADRGELALDALDDGDGFVRATAAKLLGEVGETSYAPALAALLEQDPDPVVRQRAAEALAELGQEAGRAALASGLADPVERVRLASLEGLGDLDPGFATEAVARLLAEDESWEVRARAARALAGVDDPGVVPALEGAQNAPNEYVRSAAANALRLARSRRPARTGGDAPQDE
jgi:HEAT repeat protein